MNENEASSVELLMTHCISGAIDILVNVYFVVSLIYFIIYILINDDNNLNVDIEYNKIPLRIL